MSGYGTAYTVLYIFVYSNYRREVVPAGSFLSEEASGEVATTLHSYTESLPLCLCTALGTAL